MALQSSRTNERSPRLAHIRPRMPSGHLIDHPTPQSVMYSSTPMKYNIINTETEVTIATYDTFREALTAVRLMRVAHGLGIVIGGAMVTDFSRHLA